jgi:hypothetical protein
VDSAPARSGSAEDAVDRFAAELGVARDAILRACAPGAEPPYLRLDRHAWAEMARAIPPRGPGSVPRAALATALLTLWFRSARLGSPTIKMVHAVLRTIEVRDKNAIRVVREADWVDLRGGELVLNLARLSRPLAIARAFCALQWKDYRPRRR